AGETVADAVVVHPDASGDVCVYSSAMTDIIWDQTAETTAVSAHDPLRLLDTRLPPAPPGSYDNPLRGIVGLTPLRIDQGVDYAGSGPLYAIGDGVVVSTTNSGWPGGAFIAIRLTDGPAAGDVVFEAENITPLVSIGQQVTANTVLGTLHNAYPNSELGWGSSRAIGSALAPYYGGYIQGDSTALGVNFNQLLVKLGAPSGVIQPTVDGTLPSGWPTW
ncbi:MAG: M23 family metallopeptidase, partial [Actinomycetota bacterium]|nr:M23 family metallopeptidase [Actinomycetota bacterium]